MGCCCCCPWFAAVGAAAFYAIFQLLGFFFCNCLAYKLGPIAGQHFRAVTEGDLFYRPVPYGEARPGPVVCGIYDPGSQRVGLDVSHDGKVVLIALDGETFIAALVEVADADSAVRDVPSLGVSKR